MYSQDLIHLRYSQVPAIAMRTGSLTYQAPLYIMDFEEDESWLQGVHWWGSSGSVQPTLGDSCKLSTA